MAKALQGNVQELIDSGILKLAKDTVGRYYVLIQNEKGTVRHIPFMKLILRHLSENCTFSIFKKCFLPRMCRTQ